MLYSLMKGKEREGWKEFVRVFSVDSYQPLRNIRDIQKEFVIFDLKEEGMVNETQMILVKRILNRTFKDVAEKLAELERFFITEPQKEDNFIIDLQAERQG